MAKIVIASEGMGSWGKVLIDYVLRLAFQDAEIIWDNQPGYNLIIRANWTNLEPELPLTSNQKIPYICWNGEPHGVPVRSYPPICCFYSFNYSDSSTPFFHIPYIAFFSKNSISVRAYPSANRPYFVAYCSSRVIAEREALFALLRKKDHTAHGLGKCSPTRGRKVAGDERSPALLHSYAHYRFVMAMENCLKEGYVTEKIMLAFISGAIPIYWGDANLVKEWFNPKSFICVNDFSNLDECADYIYEIDKDIDKRRAIMAEPIFKANKVPDILTLGNYENPSNYYVTIARYLQENLTFA